MAVLGLLSTMPTSAIFYFFPFTQFYLPGASIPIAAVMALTVCIPAFIVYAGFGSALPRAGGDYMFESRSIHPAVGFAFPFWWLIVVNVMSGQALAAFVGATQGFQSLLTFEGYLLNNPTFVQWGEWYSTPVGVYAVTVIIGIIPGAITGILGTKFYRFLQRWLLLPCVLITGLGLAAVLAMSTPEGFVQSFNAWGLKMTGDPNLHDTIMKAAIAGGYQTPALNWRNTILEFFSVSGFLLYSMYAAMGLLGEIKKAGNFKLLFTGFTLACLYVAFAVFVLLMVVFQNVVGWDFMHAFAFAYVNGSVSVPFYPSFSFLTFMLVGNPLVIVLLSSAFITSVFFAGAAIFVVLSRPLVAMALDGALPEWFGRINRRFHSPVNSILFLTVCTIIWTALWNFWSEFYFIGVNGYLMASTAIIGVTALAAVLFPRRASQIFKSSPVAKYGPLFPIAGLISFVEVIIISVGFLVFPELGLATSVGWAVLLGAPLLLMVYFFAWRAYQKRRGIDIDLAFKAIPPE